MPLRLALTVAFVADATGSVLMLNVPLVLPEAMVTLSGIVAPLLDPLKVTLIPVEGAGPLRVAVPVAAAPPVTELGDTETETRFGGRIVREVLTVAVPTVPERVEVFVAATAVVVTLKVTEA